MHCDEMMSAFPEECQWTYFRDHDMIQVDAQTNGTGEDYDYK